MPMPSIKGRLWYSQPSKLGPYTSERLVTANFGGVGISKVPFILKENVSTNPTTALAQSEKITMPSETFRVQTNVDTWALPGK